MSRTIGIISIKGGVGKTTVSSSLAVDLALSYGKKVLLIDANYSAPNLGLHMDILEPQKTIHHVLDNKTNIRHAMQKKFGVDVIPGDYVYNKELNYLKLKEKINQVKSRYDFVILDSSPSLNEETLSAILAADALFVVATPDYPTLSCSLKAAKLAKQRGKPIAGLILNKLRDAKYEIKLMEIENALDIPVVARIPDDISAARAIFTRIPVTLYNKSSPISKEINKLNAAITGTKEQVSFFRSLLPFGFKKEEINRQLLKNTFYNSYFGR